MQVPNKKLIVAFCIGWVAIMAWHYYLFLLLQEASLSPIYDMLTSTQCLVISRSLPLPLSVWLEGKQNMLTHLLYLLVKVSFFIVIDSWIIKYTLKILVIGLECLPCISLNHKLPKKTCETSLTSYVFHSCFFNGASAKF